MVVLFAGLFIALTQSPLTRRLAMPYIRAATPLPIDCDSVRIGLNGSIVLGGLTLRAPGVMGEAGEVLRVRAVKVGMDWASLARGSARVGRVTLVEPRVRVSQDLEGVGFNLAPLVTNMPSGGGAIERVPEVRVQRGTIELGEHDASGYRLLRATRMDGSLEPDPTGPGGAMLKLEEIGAAATARGIRVEATLRPEAGRIALTGLDLSAWPAETLPRTVREAVARLALEGRVSDAEVRYGEGPLTVSITLSGVGLNLPASKPGDEPARMRGVDGVVELRGRAIDARLTGTLEDLAYRARFSAGDASADAPFVLELWCEGFEVTRDPRLLRFAPAVALEHVARFSNPTGLIDTWVRVERGPPTPEGPGKVSARGTMTLRDVVAAFEGFPYRFAQMRGTVLFDDTAIQIREITGRAASGATITATGTIAPPTETSEVNLDIRVDNAPIDGAMLEAMGASRRTLAEAIMSRGRYDELVSLGLIRRPTDVGGDAGVPVFELGGTATVRVRVRRELGVESRWNDVVDVTIPRAGILPEHFPFPVVGRDVKLKITKRTIEVVGGTFEGLSGGVAELRASVDLPPRGVTNVKPAPDVHIAARGIPIDDRLIHALPDAALGGLPEASGTLHKLLRRLGARGTMDAVTRVYADKNGRIAFDADVTPGAVRLEPDGGSAGVALADLSGSIRASLDEVSLRLAGRVSPAESDEDSGRLTLEFRGDLRGDEEPRTPASWSLDVLAEGVETSLPLDRFVSVFSAPAAERLSEIARERRPAGRLSAALSLRDAGAGQLRLFNADGFAVDIEGGRPAFTTTSGAVAIDMAAGAARVESLAGTLADSGTPAGAFEIDGTLLAPGAGRERWTPGPDGVRASIRQLRLEAPTLAALAGRDLGPRVAQLFAERRPAGSIDAELLLSPGDSGSRLTGVLRPTSLSFDAAGLRAVFPSASGEVRVGDDGVVIDRLRLSADGWSTEWSGAAGFAPGGRSVGDAELSFRVDADRLTPELVAVLPGALRSTFDDLSVASDLPLTLPDGRLSVAGASSEAGAEIRASGTLDAAGASLNVGAPIREAKGTLRFDVFRPAVGAPPTFDLAADLESFRLADVRLTRGRFEAAGGRTPGKVDVPVIRADCHGGRFAGEAGFVTDGGVQRFEARIVLSGVRFGPVMNDLRGIEPPPDSDPGERGELNAELTLAGPVGDASARRGRGMATVGGGRVVSMPLILALIRASNLQPPTDERVRLGQARFLVEGDLIAFEEVRLASESVEIVGFGTMTWPDTSLEMDFNSRSLRRVPVLTDVLEGIRNEFVSTSVGGTLDDPQVGLSGLKGTRRALDRVFGEQSERERRMERLRREQGFGRTDPR